MQLVIVESPTKARKLSEYLGKGYAVEASVGHVRDLPAKELGIDLDHNFEPTYVLDPDKKAVVERIAELAAAADKVFLATDPDREGEAIAWHIHYLLSHPDQWSSKKKSLSPVAADRFGRATFHEITKSAVQEAISHPAAINLSLVDAQQARRVVDRLVGYKVSPVLWKKVRRGLSAGRVQSVALRMIAEREREIEAFKPEEYWEFDVALSTQMGGPAQLFANGKTPDQLPSDVLVARVIEHNHQAYSPTTESDVAPLRTHLPTSHYTVTQVERKRRERASLPPFTTSTLQQAAANQLGFTSKQTMTLAQQLYEEGLITYHRTDSVSLSSQSMGMARQYIEQAYGSEYVPPQPRFFATKSKNAQEAHEAIRVTEVHVKGEQVTAKARLTERHARLYDLIWRRFVASQMAAAVYDQTAVTITAQVPTSADTYTLKANGSVVTFPGWLKLTGGGEDTILPAVAEQQLLHYRDLNAAQKFTQPPARYNDASLVKELEKRGIGRPSTYASIISVIVDRGYVERKEKRFWATPVGLTVSDFLVKNFPVFMEYDFTAEMEEDLDRISRGEKEWHSIVGQFYQPLAQTIATVTQEAERVQIPVEETGELCPTCGATEGGKVVIRNGRFGKFKSCNRFPACNYAENLVEKVDNVRCPLCQQGDVVVKNTRWGKSFFGCSRYPECDWASWQKPQPGQVVTAAQWAEQKALRAAKKAAKAAKGGGKSFGKSSAKTSKTVRKKAATTKRKTTSLKTATTKKASRAKRST